MMQINTAVMVDDDIWFSDVRLNCLLKVNVNDWKIVHICDLGTDIHNAVSQIYYIKGFLWCVMKYGIEIYAYDISNEILNEYRMDTNESVRRENVGAVLFNNKLYVIPRNLPDELIVFSIENIRFASDSNWKNEIERMDVRGRVRILSYDTDVVAFNFFESKMLLIYKMQTGCMEQIMKDADTKYIYLTIDKNYVYLSRETKKEILRYDFITRQKEKWECLCDDIDNGYISILKIEKQLFLYDGEKIDIFNLENNLFSICEQIPKNLKSDGQIGSLFVTVVKAEERYYLLPFHANMCLQLEKGTYRGYMFDYPIKEECMRIMVQNGKLINESEEYKLQNYISALILK